MKGSRQLEGNPEDMVPIKADISRQLRKQFFMVLRGRDETFTHWLRTRITAYIAEAETRQEIARVYEGEAYAETPARAS